tara:strand:- start:290 stop:775 length:486 start_codon:yes stop_codon:yes gene_type:complete
LGEIVINKLNISDVSETYLSWLNDPEVGKFTIFGKNKWTLQKLNQYVMDSLNNPNEILFGVFIRNKKNKIHIGNVRIHDIDFQNKIGYIGIIIGDKRFWNKGFASEAIKQASKKAFKNIGLKKLIAGVEINNSSSIKIFENNGFKKKLFYDSNKVIFEKII